MNTTPPGELNGHHEAYPSFSSLKDAHTSLLKRYRGAWAAELLDEVEEFVRRGSASGVYLDSLDERMAGQSLLDYWVTLLYRARRTPPDSTLAEFDLNLTPELDDALCPYRGLNAFQEADRDIFFGRQRLIEQLIGKVKEKNLIFVVGPSGSGKTSLVLAGLLPALSGGTLDGSEDWRYLPRVLPGANPLRNLALALDPGDGQLRQTVEAFMRDREHLLKVVKERGGTHTVVVIDQFEEVFTVCSDVAARDAFIANLATLAAESDPRHTIILTIRTDYENYLAGIPDLMPFYEKGQVHVTPLSATDLRDAIEKPAHRIGLKFEEGVVDALVSDILGEPAGLPLLQFTLLRLWRLRENKRNRITLKSYRSLGGARQALALTAEEFYKSLPFEKQQTLKNILLRLARPSEGFEVISNRVRRSLLYKSGEAPYRVDEVLEALVAEGLVRLTKGDTLHDDRIEVAHEALIRNWPTLVEWLDAERTRLRNRFRLTTAAQQWLGYSKDPGLLLGGVLLEEAKECEDLNDLEVEFVQASVAAVEAAENEKKETARRERELEQARLNALEQKAAAEERSARRLRRLNRLLVLLSLLAAAAAALAIYYSQHYRALKEQNENLVRKHREADVELTISPGEAVKKYEELRLKYQEMNDARNELLVLESLTKAYDLLKQMAKTDDDWQKRINQYNDLSIAAYLKALALLGAEIEVYKNAAPPRYADWVARLEERAQLHISRNNNEKAKKDYEEALGILEQRLNKDGDSLATYGIIIRSLGNLYKQDKDADKHCKLYERALEVRKGLNQVKAPLQLYRAYMDLGLAYSAYAEFKDKFRSAERNFNNAISVINDVSDPNLKSFLVATHKELGDLYWYQGRKYLHKARREYDASLDNMDSEENSDAVEIRLGLALVRCARNESARARKESNKAVEIFEKLTKGEERMNNNDKAKLIYDQVKYSLLTTLSKTRESKYTKTQCKSVEELIPTDKFK
jgi:energy-coupling factor transporter ATP-binding protein EcfA2